LSEFRIFETDQFREDLDKLSGARGDKIAGKLEAHVYPRLGQQPYFGKNIRKLKEYSPETWRFRIGEYRFFYEVDDKAKIVFMIAADHRSKSYRRR